MAHILKCPTRDELVRLNDDELPGDLSESLFDHIESCERCSSIYGELDDPPDNLGSRFAHISPEDLEKAREDIEADVLRDTAASLFPKLSGLMRQRELQPALHPPCDVRDYRVLRRIGSGGMGEVYEAKHVLSGRHDAIKVIRRFRQDAPAAEERFLKEIRTVAQLNHPNVVITHSPWREPDGNLYLAQELLKGKSLQELVDLGEFGGPKEIIDAMIGTCRGLEHAHTKKILHRDIKPANVMRLEDGTIKVIDFGLASAAESGESAILVGAGTVGYMSPEQAHGTEPLDDRSDIYSAGRMLKYLLAKTPIASASKRQIRAARKLEALADWMTHKSPKARPKNITVVISRLEKIRRDLLRSRVKTALAASVILAAVALGIWVIAANYGDNTGGITDRADVQDEVTRQLDARQQQAKKQLEAEQEQFNAALGAELAANVAEAIASLPDQVPVFSRTSPLLMELWSQLPGMVTSTVPQPPTYDQGTGELVYTVRLAPDEAAYRASLPRLRQTLDSIAVGKPEETTVRPTKLRSVEPGDVLPVYSIPQLESDPRTAGTQGIVSLLIDWNSAQTFQVWRHYVVDFGSIDVTGAGLQSIKPTRQHWLQTIAARGDDDFGKVMAFTLMSRTVETRFFDDAGAKVDVDSWEWLGRNYVDVGLPQNTLSNGLAADRTLSGVPNLLVSPTHRHLGRPDEPVLVAGWTQGSQSDMNNFHVTIAPFSMVQSTFAGTTRALVFSPACVQTRTVRLDSELWRKIATVKVSTRVATAK